MDHCTQLISIPTANSTWPLSTAGKIEVAINETESIGHYMDVRFKGIADNAANSGRVNHFAIGSVLELRFGPHYRAQIITTPATHFGIDGYEAAVPCESFFRTG